MIILKAVDPNIDWLQYSMHVSKFRTNMSLQTTICLLRLRMVQVILVHAWKRLGNILYFLLFFWFFWPASQEPTKPKPSDFYWFGLK